MNDSTKFRLLCIVTDNNLKVRNSSFSVTVPSDEEFGGIIGYLTDATPSLKGIDYGKFRLYKPPSGYPIRVSDPLDGLQLTDKHASDLLPPPCKVKEKFQEKEADERFDVDVIIRVNFGERGTLSHLLVDKPSV